MAKSSVKEVQKKVFSFEKLPRFGKEYWFFLLISNKPEKGRQFMSTFGDQNAKDYKVDRCRIKRKYEFKGDHEGPSSYWFYDNKIKISSTLMSSIKINDREIRVRAGKREILLEGEYPSYRLTVRSNGRIVCDVKTSRGSDYTEYEVIEHSTSGMKAGYINMFLNFRGKLNGSPFRGYGYIQKVFSTAPVPGIPWYWSRIYFPNRYIIDFIQPYLSVLKRNKEFTLYAYLYDIRKKKKYSFEKVKVSKYGKNNRKFLVNARDKNSELTMLLDVYARKKFLLSSIGTMNYEQNLVRVKDISFETGNKIVTKKETGEGTGIFEDSYGYIL